MTPSARQQEFLDCTCREALYGGAAGGGKSEALLMWLAKGVHLSTYSGIIFRRMFSQLSKSNDSLVAKSRRLYPALGGVYNKTLRQWNFPSGAMIELGAMEHEDDMLNYQGNSYHRVAFDELTHFTENQYDFIINTRTRRTLDFPIPCGARAASNPGGIGHAWVKNRFITDEAMEVINGLDVRDPTPPGTIFYTDKGRAYIPARVADNPHINIDEYIASLSEVTDPIMRNRMLNGDWSIRRDGVIPADKLRYYTMQGEMYCDDLTIRVHDKELLRFVIVDCAGTSEEVAKEQRGGKASFSVAQVWDWDAKHGILFLRDMLRGRWTFPELLDKVDSYVCRWQPAWTGIEDEKTGRALLQHLRRRGFNLKALSPEGKDKLTRAAPFLNRVDSGQIYLPKTASWLPELMNEWLSWTGHPDEMADTIDPAAYAAREVMRSAQVFHVGRSGLAAISRN